MSAENEYYSSIVSKFKKLENKLDVSLILESRMFQYFTKKQAEFNASIDRLKSTHYKQIKIFLKENMGLMIAPEIKPTYKFIDECDENIIILKELLELFEAVDFERLENLRKLKPILESHPFKERGARNKCQELIQSCEDEIYNLERYINDFKVKILNRYSIESFNSAFGYYAPNPILTRDRIRVNTFICWIWSADQDFEAFITNVLCHETAHAFHHQGQDFNNKRCQNFRQILEEKYFVEGIAQHYTNQFAQFYKKKLPDIKKTFDHMNEKLMRKNSPYRWHETWEYNKQVIKDAFIKSRQKKYMDKEIFNKILKQEEENYHNQ